MLTDSLDKQASDARSANKNQNSFMEHNARLAALNKAYYFGEYDLSEYRQLRDALIDDITQKDNLPQNDNTQRINTIQHNNTLKIDPQKPHTVAVKSIVPPSENIEQQSGPSVLQFLWVSVAVIVFIYMYTATID